MVEFNDRRQGKHQIYGEHGDPSMDQIHGIREAIDSGRRVITAHAGNYNTSPLGAFTGYLRQDPDGTIRSYHNSRSTRGVQIHPEDVGVIESARKNRKGGRDTFLAFGSE